MPWLSCVDQQFPIWEPSFLTENGSLLATLHSQAGQMKLFTDLDRKDILQAYYSRKEVSIIVYINVMSYLLVCWVYYELPTPSPLAFLQLPLW